MGRERQAIYVLGRLDERLVQVPKAHHGTGDRFYPFSLYGGRPVEADFVPHMVEKAADGECQEVHAMILSQRFGFTSPMRVGNTFHDTGLLQDMFQHAYRTTVDAPRDTLSMTSCHTYISNWMAYARTHAIIALASGNVGLEEGSTPLIVRNLYRTYVDTHVVGGVKSDAEAVPVVLGFEAIPSDYSSEDPRNIIVVAGSLCCVNTKVAAICQKPLRDGLTCPSFKLSYLNDATMLMGRILRKTRQELRRKANYEKIKAKRPDYSETEHNKNLWEINCEHIHFLHHMIIRLLAMVGADTIPWSVLEFKDAAVDADASHDTDLVGNDFLTPKTFELIRGMDWNSETLTRTQMALLSLYPPDAAIIAASRFTAEPDVQNIDFIKKQIQKRVAEDNKKVWSNFTKQILMANMGVDHLSGSEPFTEARFEDPIEVAERLGLDKKERTTSFAERSSDMSQLRTADTLRKRRGEDSAAALLSSQHERDLQAMRDLVEREHAKYPAASGRSKLQALAKVKGSPYLKDILAREYGM